MKINTIPNWITLIRFLLYVLILVVLLGNITWLRPYILPTYILVFFMDKLDGWVARTFNQASEVGQFFDLSVDRAIVTTMLICYLYFYPSVIILILLIANLIRDFLVAGVRQLAAIKLVFLKAHILGKLKFITENLSVILMAILLSYPNMGSYGTIIHESIKWILVLGTIFGWWAFGLYLRQVLSIKQK
ncbi:CDP-alcohol phosphatidyltransferase family protein [Candidatus Shapirobacteria bacterium]|nr:CDP-alcohol phosphatidyltransferase family protein [Candidatus Shapirobacteria bacterium]